MRVNEEFCCWLLEDWIYNNISIASENLSGFFGGIE